MLGLLFFILFMDFNFVFIFDHYRFLNGFVDLLSFISL